MSFKLAPIDASVKAKPATIGVAFDVAIMLRENRAEMILLVARSRDVVDIDEANAMPLRKWNDTVSLLLVLAYLRILDQVWLPRRLERYS